MLKPIATSRYIWRAGNLLASLSLAFSLGSCIDDRFDVEAAGGSPEDNILVTAGVDASGQTRSTDRHYIKEGPVTEGRYFLQYQTGSSNSYMSNGFVDFGFDEAPETGFGFWMDGDTPKDLKWKHVYNKGTGYAGVSFYLTNVDYDMYTITSAQQWHNFNIRQDIDNPYVSGVLDEELGTNDILYGSVSGVKSTGGKINFTLQHALSLVKVNVEVYPADDDFMVKLDRAEVSITDVANKVTAFNVKYPGTYQWGRTGGSSNGAYDDVRDRQLVVNGDEELIWDNVEDGVSEDGYKMTTYTSKRFVFPPQTFPVKNGTGANATMGRPKLSIKIPKEDAMGFDEGVAVGGYITYSGYLPDVMFQLDDEGNILPVPEQLWFKNGTQVNITATINSPNTQLTFAPVKVETWHSKSSFSLITKQAGIYNKTNFRDMVERFKTADPDAMERAMERFGYVQDGRFYFQLWGRVEMDRAYLSECMRYIRDIENTGFDFRFILNGYSVVLINDDGSEEELYGPLGAEKLYNLVTGKDIHEFIGVNTPQDLLGAIDVLNRPDANIADIFKYCTPDNSENKILIDVEESYEVDVQDILKRVPTHAKGSKIEINIADGKQIKVVIPGSEEFFVCSNQDEIGLTERLFKKNDDPQLHNMDDIRLLIRCYNDVYPYCNDILSIMGTLNSQNRWSFKFNISADTEVEGDEMFLKMVPNGADRPDFSFTGTSDTKNRVIVNSKWLGTFRQAASYPYYLIGYMLSGSGSTTSVSQLVGYYQKNDFHYLWNYGYFDPEIQKWTFVVKQSPSVAYTTLAGKMIPDPADLKYDLDFKLNPSMTITNVPTPSGTNDGRLYLTDTPENREIVKSIVTGTYVPQ